MDKEIDGLIFDIDGTLWDVRKEVAESWKAVIEENTDWPVTFDAESLGSMFGRTMTDIFQTLYPDIPEREFETIREKIYEKQTEYLLKYKPSLYDGTAKVLEKLAEKYNLYIVTNAQKGYIETLFEVSGIKKYFRDWMCFGDTNAPKNVTITKLMEKNHLHKAVYIGDTQGDADSCMQAGIPMIYAAYGLGQVENPLAAIGDIKELPQIIQRAESIDTVIFDLDGTLLNTLEDLANSVNAVLEAAGMPKRTIMEIKSFVGNGVGKLMERAVVPGTSKEEIEELLKKFRQHYSLHSLDHTKPYEGILELLRSLKAKGYEIGIVSNKFDGAVKELAAHFFGNLIDLAMGEHEGVQKKPAPDMVLEALREMKKERYQAVYIGDSEVDVETAANAAMRLIMVEWGFRERAVLEEQGAKYFVSCPEDVMELLTDVSFRLDSL